MKIGIRVRLRYRGCMIRVRYKATATIRVMVRVGCKAGVSSSCLDTLRPPGIRRKIRKIAPMMPALHAMIARHP
eukprot:516475-Amorphochlora_amoeboformis.AAC.1